MKKPEKKEIINDPDVDILRAGYNKACDEWEAFLPSEEEICEIIFNHRLENGDWTRESAAKAIHNRLKG